MKNAVLGFLACSAVAVCGAAQSEMIDTLNYQVDVTGSESIWKGPHPLPPPGLSGPGNVSYLNFTGVLSAQIVLDNTANGMLAIETTTITGSATGVPLVLGDTLFQYSPGLTYVQSLGQGSLTLDPSFNSAIVHMGDHLYRESQWTVDISSTGAYATYGFNSSGGCLSGSYTPGSCTLDVTSTSAGTWTATTPVPLPAAGWLMLSGLGGMLLLRGRRC